MEYKKYKEFRMTDMKLSLVYMGGQSNLSNLTNSINFSFCESVCLYPFHDRTDEPIRTGIFSIDQLPGPL